MICKDIKETYLEEAKWDCELMVARDKTHKSYGSALVSLSKVDMSIYKQDTTTSKLNTQLGIFNLQLLKT